MTRVLVVDDEPQIVRALVINLKARKYEVDAAPDGATALQLAAARHPDVVVLDLGLPDMDGVEVIRGLRGWTRVPVLVLSARHTSDEKVEALDAGADDYVTKPFRLAELLARVRALLRRTPLDAPADTGDLVRIDSDGRRAWFKGEELQLTAKEFDLLRVLVREQGKVVSREQLMREIWDTSWFGSTKTLDMHISVLRRKLGDEATSPQYIATVRGVGFRFERPRPE